MPQLCFFLSVDDFYIGEARAMKSTKIYYPFTSVNQTLVPHFFKCLIALCNYLVIQGVSKSAPIATGSEGSYLSQEVALVELHKIPHLLVEFFS